MLATKVERLLGTELLRLGFVVNDRDTAIRREVDGYSQKWFDLRVEDRLRARVVFDDGEVKLHVFDDRETLVQRVAWMVLRSDNWTRVLDHIRAEVREIEWDW